MKPLYEQEIEKISDIESKYRNLSGEQLKSFFTRDLWNCFIEYSKNKIYYTWNYSTF